MKFKTRFGFTLIECLIAVIVLGIVLTFSVSAYQHWRSFAESKKTLTELSSAISLTESYALTTRRSVTLCQSQSGQSCDGQWSEGFVVFFDENNRHQIEDLSERIKIFTAIGSSGTLSFYGFPSSNYWHYQAKIGQNQQNGSFVYCDQGAEGQDWVLVLSKTGRYRVDHERDQRC